MRAYYRSVCGLVDRFLVWTKPSSSILKNKVVYCILVPGWIGVHRACVDLEVTIQAKGAVGIGV